MATATNRNSENVASVLGGVGGRSSRRIPPPPLPDEFGWDQAEQLLAPSADEPNDNANEGERADWILRVKCFLPPPLPPQQPQQRNKQASMSYPLPSVCIQIHVHDNMSSESLGKCLQQAISSCTGTPSGEVAGLFGERDGIFHSLEQILRLPNPTVQGYSTVQPPPRPQHVPRPSTWTFWDVLVLLLLLSLILTFAWAVYWDYPFWPLVQQLPRRIMTQLIDLPFQELYRYGPHVVGWEGMDMPEVCSRITYHGNREFWQRNLGECQAIYEGKEEAFLRICRPLAYLGIGIVLFYVVRHLIAIYAEGKRDRTDRVVYETYHAFQTLVRLANRQTSSRGGR